jgi:hypothetical protein
MVAEIEADMAEQLARVREMERNGELEPIPEVSATTQKQMPVSHNKAPEVLTTPSASFLGSGGCYDTCTLGLRIRLVLPWAA